MRISTHVINYHDNGYNTHNASGHKIFPLISTHKSGILCWILVLTGGKHSYIQGPGIGAEVL